MIEGEYSDPVGLDTALPGPQRGTGRKRGRPKGSGRGRAQAKGTSPSQSPSPSPVNSTPVCLSLETDRLIIFFVLCTLFCRLIN